MYWFVASFYGLAALVLLGAAIFDTRSYIAQLVDWRWDRTSTGKLAKVNAKYEADGERPVKVNWARARIQQYAVARMCIPLGLLVLGGMAYSWHQASHWSFYAWGPYAIGAAAWFLSTPLRYIWTVVVTCKINRKIVDDEIAVGVDELMNGIYVVGYGTRKNPTIQVIPYRYSAGQIIRHHFAWALSSRQTNSSRTPRRYFHVHLKWMNPVINFILNRLKFRLGAIKLFWPILAYGAASIVWPIAGLCAVFYMRGVAFDQSTPPDSQPWFARKRSEPPMPTK
ncbi:MAG: hypothetical protein ACQR33_00225 [Candidatus Saccharibacteria bacterium]